MTTKKKYILGLLALTVIMFFTYFMTNRHSENEIMVTVDNKLNIDKVKIQFGFFNSNSGNDFSLTQNGLSRQFTIAETKKILRQSAVKMISI
jgi:hypothetical protein